MAAETFILIGSIVLLLISIGLYAAVQWWRAKVLKEPHPASRPFICDGATSSTSGQANANDTPATNG